MTNQLKNLKPRGQGRWPESLEQVAVPNLDAAIAALVAYEPEFDRISKAFNDAQVACRDLPKHGVEPPAALVVITPAYEIRIRERSHPVKETSFTYKDEDSIREHGFKPEREAEMLAALAVWKAEIAKAERLSGVAKLVSEEQKADLAFQRAIRHREKLSLAILNAPVASPADVRRKLIAYARANDVKQPDQLPFDEYMALALKAVMNDLSTLGKAPDPASSRSPDPVASMMDEFGALFPPMDAEDNAGEAYGPANLRIAEIEARAASERAKSLKGVLFQIAIAAGHADILECAGQQLPEGRQEAVCADFVNLLRNAAQTLIDLTGETQIEPLSFYITELQPAADNGRATPIKQQGPSPVLMAAE